jgi:hypothetical protein
LHNYYDELAEENAKAAEENKDKEPEDPGAEEKEGGDDEEPYAIHSNRNLTNNKWSRYDNTYLDEGGDNDQDGAGPSPG